ncbi:hypothetical protein [Mycoplasmopsis alligatoris]|uniref:Uncharacterized protein n=1 Tax=Mycoplasmopsis alligatoris A21JP2 TaxID=747682 RepID=D4XWD5_9BACT|nr:hypothetical protein [Mycoplasmopsis alligatoris]EFF41323.1 hypothetical protein MALL_0495 [Mycoplasmopsis alligatoris A21JP2]
MTFNEKIKNKLQTFKQESKKEKCLIPALLLNVVVLSVLFVYLLIRFVVNIAFVTSISEVLAINIFWLVAFVLFIWRSLAYKKLRLFNIIYIVIFVTMLAWLIAFSVIFEITDAKSKPDLTQSYFLLTGLFYIVGFSLMMFLFVKENKRRNLIKK